MKTGKQTSFWLETPAGTSAIAVTTLTGPDAGILVSKFFRSIKNDKPVPVPVGEFRYGVWRNHQQEPENPGVADIHATGEDLLVCRTDDERFEIHSHGGRIATTRIASDLQNSGAILSTWQENLLATIPWYRAWPEIVFQQATTLRTASILGHQRHNWIRLGERMRQAIDGHSLVIDPLQLTLEWENFGRHLTIPRKLVLFGPPNAGKSSLMNRLGGFDRSIIHDVPGTTRDVVTHASAIDGWPVEFLDTAGIRIGIDDIERQGIDLARTAISSAELRMLVLDSANVPDCDQLNELLETNPGLIVWNKVDLSLHAKNDLGNSITVSALTGEGVPELIHRIGELLVPKFPESDLAIPLNEEMASQLQKALAFAIEDNRVALRQLFAK